MGLCVLLVVSVQFASSGQVKPSRAQPRQCPSCVQAAKRAEKLLGGFSITWKVTPFACFYINNMDTRKSPAATGRASSSSPSSGKKSSLFPANWKEKKEEEEVVVEL